MRPSRPVPSICPISTPRSETSFRTAGERRAPGRSLLGAAAGPCATDTVSRATGGGGGAVARIDDRKRRTDLDGLAFPDQYLAQSAGNQRRHLGRHLICFDLDQQFVDRDLVAFLFVPGRDRTLFDGFPQLG